MLKGENIIVFSSADWKIGPTSPQHISTNFAQENKILFVETFGSRIPILEREHIKRIINRILNWLKGVRKKDVAEQKHLYIYSPIALLINSKLFLFINRLIFLNIVRRLIKKFDFKDPILYFYLPPPPGAIDRLQKKAVIYHSVDDWLTFPGGKNKFFMDAEKKLIEEADLVLTSNEYLYQQKRSYARRIRRIYHGVDYEHFTKRFDEGTPLPDDIKNIPRPIIAIIGNFAYWIDLELIELISKRHKEWSIVSIGSVDSNVGIRDLRNTGNIYFLGQKKYSKLPNYYRAIDVFIIPFLLVDRTKTCSPTRLYEHLSSGKPIVTTDLPVVHDLGEEIIYIASDREDFVKKIEMGLEEKDTSVAERRKALARENTWKSKIEEISAIMQKIIDEKSRQ